MMGPCAQGVNMAISIALYKTEQYRKDDADVDDIPDINANTSNKGYGPNVSIA